MLRDIYYKASQHFPLVTITEFKTKSAGLMYIESRSEYSASFMLNDDNKSNQAVSKCKMQIAKKKKAKWYKFQSSST